MHLKHLPLFISVLFFSFPSFGQTTIEGSIMHDGLERTYRLYVPASYSASTAVPLLFNLHGYTSNAVQQEFYGNFRPIADTANFIIVHPNGILDGSQSQFWNAFGAAAVDDVGFISALIDSISADYSIDANCVYSTGMSNGGFMSYELACQLGHRIAAVASVTGSMVQSRINACDLAHPTPIMQIHGTADPTVLYGGVAQGSVGIEALVDVWVGLNNCSTTPTVTAVPNISLTDGCTSDHFLYANGDAGVSVEFYRVNGGGHTWPGAPITIGVTSQDFSASVEIWRFFRQYKLDQLTSIGAVSASEKPFSVFPNPSGENMVLQFGTTEMRTVQVHNATGQLVWQHRSNENSIELEMERSGVYFLTVRSDSGTFTEKLIRR